MAAPTPADVLAAADLRGRQAMDLLADALTEIGDTDAEVLAHATAAGISERNAYPYALGRLREAAHQALDAYTEREEHP